MIRQVIESTTLGLLYTLMCRLHTWPFLTSEIGFYLGLIFVFCIFFISYRVSVFVLWLFLSCILCFEYLSFRQSRLGRSIMFCMWPFVGSFVHSLLAILWTRCFENEWTDFAANWYKWSTAKGDKTVNFWGQKVIGQGHTTLKLEVKTFSTLMGWVALLVYLYYCHCRCYNQCSWLNSS